ncbi:NAD(P)-dependent oxidoreductase [Flectobacillus major]|uniref:NAD(P)-dependent oxidoreductase n=1 Tax=Flectobacillus major TaxID=103 RepID=UPI00041FCB13|nr:NAD(P)-dependent oxidoreductase [Flectobacillus major]
MKVAVIGASGFVGSAVLKEALSRGYEVLAIVRHPEKITTEAPNLTIVKGDVNHTESFVELIKGVDAVLSAYNPGWENPNIYDESLKGFQAIQAGVKAAGVKRLLVIGGAGSLEVAPGVQLVDTPEFPEAWKAGALGARDYLTIIRQETELDWTFLSPAIMLVPGERTGTFRLGGDQLFFNEKGESTISVEDLAVAFVDELEKGQFIRQRFTVAY